MSTLTRTGIMNLALREICALRVDDWQEDSPHADIGRDVWDQARRKALSRTEWSFARRTRKLGQTTAETDSAFTYKYGRPGDFIRFVQAADNVDFEPIMYDHDFLEEDGSYYSDAENFYLRFVYDHETVGAWPPLFVDVLVADLAAVMASPLKSTTAREGLEELALKRLRDGRSGEGSQKPTVFMPASRWVRAQKGGASRSPSGKWYF